MNLLHSLIQYPKTGNITFGRFVFSLAGIFADKGRCGAANFQWLGMVDVPECFRNRPQGGAVSKQIIGAGFYEKFSTRIIFVFRKYGFAIKKLFICSDSFHPNASRPSLNQTAFFSGNLIHFGIPITQ